MSSHHVIRENQEPALIIQDFNSIDLESLGQILEWSPTLLSNEYSLDYLSAEGIKVDVVFTESESIVVQEHTQLFFLQGSFIASALDYLIVKKHKAVNILADSIPSCLPIYAEQINIVLFYQAKRFVFVKIKYEKWKPKGELVYVDSKYLESFQGLNHIRADIFEVVKDGFISLEFSTNEFVLIGEDL